jgi:hypothetical protein
MPRRRLILALLSLIGLSVCGTSFAQTNDSTNALQSRDRVKAPCSEVALTLKPGWVHSGGFTPGGSLLVVDSLYATIFRYSESGESLGSVGEPLKRTLQDLLPVSGKSRGDGFVVEVSDGLMPLDKRLRPAVTKRVLSSGGKEWNVGGLWQWEPVGKNDVVAFVDLVRGTDRRNLDNWRTGFVRFPLDNPGQVKVLALFDLNDTPNKGYFRSGYSYITSIGETAYMLSLNKGVTLYKNDNDKLEDISYLLPQSLHRPTLPDWRELSEYVDMMKQIEREPSPVGLFGGRDALYLLYRSPLGQGKGAKWELYNIDPSRKRPTRRVDLPIRANHVTVIPGPKNWAFIEKGPVLDYGSQDNSRVLFIPTELLGSPQPISTVLCSVAAK